MSRLSFTWCVTKNFDGWLLREYLMSEKQISRQLLTDIKFRGGQIQVNGKAATVRHRLREGDEVTVFFPKETVSQSMKPYDAPLDIVYEDEHVLVVNKPAGLPTIPSQSHPDVSLAQAILAYYEKNNISSTIHVVTRLDRDTSGLVLVAKHRYAHSLLAKKQVQKHIERRYLAIVEGRMKKEKGTITLPIARKSSSIIERTVAENGQEAITHYETIGENETHSLLEIQLETGRTHQIRVHFSALGHPLAGDTLYGGNTDIIARQALHCVSIHFQHPFSREWMMFTSKPPKDMRSIIETMNVKKTLAFKKRG